MITIISGTNRPDNMTSIVSGHYLGLLAEQRVEAQVLDLRQLPHDIAFNEVFGRRSEAMNSIIHQYIEPVNKFLFVIPEYNGSFPGVLKTFIDAVHPRHFIEKKAGIIGVSDGRSGNLRGQEHLTGILHYLRMHVHYAKPKLSGILYLIDENRHITDEGTLRILKAHAGNFAEF